jgi:hypothetical protein
MSFGLSSITAVTTAALAHFQSRLWTTAPHLCHGESRGNTNLCYPRIFLLNSEASHLESPYYSEASHQGLGGLKVIWVSVITRRFNNRLTSG